jgi:hypothetical protein
MRFLILALLFVGHVSAQAPEPTGERIVFTRAELDAMQQEMETLVRQREEAAFKAGRADARERCPSLI